MDKIKELMDTFKGEIYNFCFEILESSDDEGAVFEFICKNFKSRLKKETREIKEYFSESEIQDYELTYGDTVNGLLNSAIKKCNAGLIVSDDFYKALWKAYCANFSDIKEKAFALYYTIIDATIPYQYLGKPVSMSNERFQELLKENKDNIEKIAYIKISNYSQHTERASLLLNCLNSIDDFESKTVVLAYAIKILSLDNELLGSTGIQKLLKQLKEITESDTLDDSKTND